MTQRGMLEADGGSEEGGGGSVVGGQRWGNGEVRGGGGWGLGPLGPAAEAVVLIPSWQVEKCEGLCAEEAARHYEVLCVPSVRRRLIRVRGVLP